MSDLDYDAHLTDDEREALCFCDDVHDCRSTEDSEQLRRACDANTNRVERILRARLLDLAQRAEAAEAAVERVRQLHDETDAEGYEHNGHADYEGEPDCPGCWRDSIRRALNPKADQ